MHSPQRRLSNETTFATMITIVFLAAALFNVSHHVLWRDEWRWWQIAEASPTPSVMRSNMQYEGTPWLWYATIWALTRITANIFAMQILHVLVAAATVFIFARRAPFSRTVRGLFPFGYFPFFEYATISRNYAIMLFLFVAATAVAAAPRFRPISFSILLGLLTQTSIWGSALACVLAAAWLTQWLILQPQARNAPAYRCLTPFVVTAIGCGVCYGVSLPGPGESFIAHWPDEMGYRTRLSAAFANIWNGWMPLPRVTRNYWNTNWLDGLLTPRFFLSCALLTTTIFSLLRRPAALVMLLGGLAGLTTFTFLHFVGTTRHQGLLFIVLISACWIGAASAPITLRRPRIARINSWFEARSNRLLVAWLGIHAVVGVGANLADNRHPFSASIQIADFLRREFPGDIVVVGYDDYSYAPVGIHLGRRIYSAQMAAMPPFFSQNDAERTKDVKLESLLKQIQAIHETFHSDVVLLLTSYRDAELAEELAEMGNPPAWERIREFDDSTVADEGAVVYLVRRPILDDSNPVTPNQRPE